jgi:uncharacterized protein (TIGR02145 family)
MDCKYYDITISQTDIDNAVGNTNPAQNDVVFVNYIDCNGDPTNAIFDTAGFYPNFICVEDKGLVVPNFYQNNDNRLALNSSVTEQGDCSATPTPTPTNTQTPTNTLTPTQTPTNTQTQTPSKTAPKIKCGLGAIKVGSEYYYTDCCGNFISGVNNTNNFLEVTMDYGFAFGGVGLLSVTSSVTCATATPTPTQTQTPTNTVTPTVTPTNTITPTPSITPSVTPSNSPVTRIQNSCDVITLFDMGISCNVIQNPSSPTSLDGIISVNVTGGTAPYTFTWNGSGGHNQTLYGVPAGSYEVVVTDYRWPDGELDGVSDYTATTICTLFGPTPTPTPTTTITPTPTTPVQCVDLCLIAVGQIGVPNFGPIQFVCNGTQNDRFKWTSDRYEIIWNPINNRWEIYIIETNIPLTLGGGILVSTSLELIPDSAWAVFGGTEEYSLTMTRGNCPPVIPLQVITEQTNSTCQGTTNCNGSIFILAENGYPPYLYSIDGGITNDVNNNFTNLCPNTYSVVVTDSQNNTQTSSVNIGYDSLPVTYQLSLVNIAPATLTTVPNISQTVSQAMTLVVTPPLPVGLSVTFDLLSTALMTLNGPGNGGNTITWSVSKNNLPVNTSISPLTVVSQGTRPNCSPNTQYVTSLKYSSNITITNGDIIDVISTTVNTISVGEVATQTNCTTNLITEISSVISEPTIVGNDCSFVVGSSRQVQTNDFTFVPTEPPTVLRCFGYLYNWYAATDVRNISAAGWEVPTMSDYQILANYLGAAGNYVSNVVGGKLKETGLTYWITPNAGATNEVGFNGIGSAGRIGAGFTGLGTNGNLWVRNNASATNGNLALLYSSIQNFQCTTSASYPKFNGYALRLKKITTTLVNGQTGTYVGNDGKTYDTICIGTQEWVSQNLTETKYRDLSDIPNVTAQSTWNGLTTGAYCIYNNDPLNVNGCPSLPPIPDVLVHPLYGSGSISGLCGLNQPGNFSLYSYSSQGTSPEAGIVMYQYRGPNNVLSLPVPPIVYAPGGGNVVAWNGGGKYSFQIEGAPGVITTITPCT